MMKNYALVTGASKGIGREIALQLAQRGYPLLLVSRNAGELSALAALVDKEHQVKALWLAVDLSEPGATQKVADWCVTESFKIEVLINNAGYGLWGDFDKIELKNQLNMINLNINALVALTSLLLPILKQSPQAYILNVASTAAYQAIPTLAVYAATKSFVLSFSRALNFELTGSNVSVSCLSPGPTDTGFAQRAGMDALKELADKFNMSPALVAQIAVKGLFNKRIEIIPGFLNAAGARLVSFVPKRLIEKTIGNLYKVPGK
ncbi:SDR family NAD(P)-dependent oxidoreductase [Mucilaginibacter phenanthrenivorans]|uniref:SDR family NAD(P)-dependent oxidoreductase n=1 Tax=Mucilaginibacter phenanthrenivorans TaxID=1234842 RepID=UPI002158143F|nr:SDR family oxidoreductase [Mucilaginibacter phenanthrenivorans]